MKRSTDRILTTHTGSLHRPRDLEELLRPKFSGESYDERALQTRLRSAVKEIVAKHADLGVDVVNDGEYSKSSWASYVHERMSGLAPSKERPNLRVGKDRTEFADFYAAIGPQQGFYYEDWELGIAGVLREEYLAITDAGLIVSIDDAFLPYLYDMRKDMTLKQFRRWANRAVEALNLALEGIPEEKVRCHICWGSWNGPHSADIPLREIVDLVLKVNAQAYSIEAANPRHAFEWQVWEDVKLPDGKILIPGVVEHATNVVEHPETVADRIIRFANVVGRENVIVGTDCGYRARIRQQLAWAKQRAITEGAEIATKRLWRKPKRAAAKRGATMRGATKRATKRVRRPSRTRARA